MPINIGNLNAKEIYIGNQKIKEIYVGTEKVYGGKVVEYYFRSQEDIKRALRDQVSNVEERSVELYQNRMRTTAYRFALPIGIEKPKIVEIKGIIKNTDYGRLPEAQVGVGNYDRNYHYTYLSDGIDTRNNRVRLYSNNNDYIYLMNNSGNTEINFTLTLTYISSRYIGTSEMQKYSVKATGNIYNNFNIKSFTLENIREFNPFSSYFLFEIYNAEIEIEYFKAQ